MLAVADPQTTRAWLTRPLDTFRRTYQPGESFKAVPVGIDGMWDLFDRQGVLCVSHCPEEAITFDQVNHGEERDRAEFPHREPQDGDNGRGADQYHFGHESESDRRSLARVPQCGSEGPGAAICPFDPNVELQLTREPRSVEPRHAPGMARRTLARAELPQRPAGYVAPLIEGRRAPPPGAVLSAEHPRRGEWGPEWSIALYAIPSGGRTIFCASLNDNKWRQFVDLDHGEWRNWNGPWMPLVGSHVCEFGEYPEWKTLSQTTTTGGQVAQEERLKVDASSFVPPCLCGENNFPEPHHAMTTDERRGHRRVRNERGDIVWRCGPGPGETFAAFAAWRQRLDQFFETGVGG